MDHRLEKMVDENLAHVCRMFDAHPEMKSLLRDMSFAVCADLAGIEPAHDNFPVLLAEKCSRLFEANFRAILAQVESLDPGFRTACSSGCSYCCSSHITLTPQEAFNIGLHLSRTCEELEFIRLAEECVAGANGLEAVGLQEFARNYFKSCPFLQDNKCSIYEVRPIVCRNWISADLSACVSSYESGNKVTVPQNALIMVQKDLIFAGQQAFLAGFGINGSIGSFLPLMAQVLTDFEGTYARWLSGELLRGQMN